MIDKIDKDKCFGHCEVCGFKWQDAKNEPVPLTRKYVCHKCSPENTLPLEQYANKIKDLCDKLVSDIEEINSQLRGNDERNKV